MLDIEALRQWWAEKLQEQKTLSKVDTQRQNLSFGLQQRVGEPENAVEETKEDSFFGDLNDDSS